MSEISEPTRDSLHIAIMNIPVESHQATNRDYKIGHRAALHSAAELVSEFVSKLPTSPSWQDRPTGPGLWMKRSGTVVMVVPHDMGQRHIEQWPGGRVFGPIPADEGTAHGRNRNEMITITLPLPPRSLSPNGRSHWATKSRATKKYRRDAELAAVSAMMELNMRFAPQWELATAKVSFYWRTAAKHDSDNSTASIKAGFDGIADAGVIKNDSGLTPMPPEMFVDRKNPRVEITIQEIATAQ